MTATIRVLYAEDNAQDADLARSHFREHAPDIEIAIVTTGEACLERLRGALPDVLLLDHHLPDMEGLDVLRRVVHAGVRVPVVLVTGVGDEELVVKALRLGASNYVPKAGNYIELLPDLLRAVVEEHGRHLTQTEPEGTRYRVLYAEHVESDADLTLRHFAEAAPRFEVEVVRTAEESLGRLAESSFDAVLIDLRMPGLNGLDLVREAGRRRLPLPPFIMVTGKGDEAAAVASLKLGAADYISKRAGYLDDLVYAVDRAIAHDRLRRVNERLQLELAEHERAEQARRESESRFASLADGAPIIIWVTDAEGGNRFVNRAYTQFFGVPLEQVEGGRWQPFVHPDDAQRYVGEFRNAVREQVPFRSDARMRRADGEWRRVSSYAEPRFSAAREFLGHAGITLDVTEQRQAEDSLREANARMAEDDRRKDEFIAILSHELRNPLAPIRYALPLIEREQLRETAARAVAVIERQVDYLSRLVDDLLDVSRITRGRIELRPEYVTLGSILTAAVESASPAVAAARHTLKIAVPEEPIWLHADAARLAQVVTNLLNNSAKYTPRGGEITLEAGRENGAAVVRVRDTGVGIPVEALPTIFEMFHQVWTGPDKSKGGLGIGLALVKRLVQMHGGTVEARSAGVGQGAEFTVRLPAVAGPIASEVPEPAPAPASVRRLKVLIVDDNADLVEMLAVVVSALGHDVRKALDGGSALSAALSYRPDVVLLDLGLPVMSGLDVAREMRRRPELAGAKLVALTGWGKAEDRRQTREAGFDHHLTKPTAPKALADLLARFAAGWAA